MARQLQDAYIVAATRTAVGKAPRGALRHTRPDTLLAHVLKSVLAQVPQIDPTRIEDVIVGCAMPEYEQGMNVARIGLLLAGLPNSVAGMTINRFCSSGLNAVSIAADRIRTGEADIVIAGGTESMSMIPMLGRLAVNADVFANDENLGIAYGMGLTAEKVAAGWKVSREDQDAFALESHTRALAAQAAGEFNVEIAPLMVVSRASPIWRQASTVRTTEKAFARDEGPRADTSAEGLAKLRPVFAAKGSVTAGNSSQTSDGAGASILVSERVLKEFSIAPLARWVGFAVAGVPPEVMGVGPIAAIPKSPQDDRHPAGPGDGLDRTQRSVRSSKHRSGARAWPRSCQGQSARRSNRARTPARCDRRGSHGNHCAWAQETRPKVRHGVDVHRHRHGRGGDL